MCFIITELKIIKLREKCVQYMKVAVVIIQIGKHITAGSLINNS